MAVQWERFIPQVDYDITLDVSRMFLAMAAFVLLSTIMLEIISISRPKVGLGEFSLYKNLILVSNAGLVSIIAINHQVQTVDIHIPCSNTDALSLSKWSCFVFSLYTSFLIALNGLSTNALYIHYVYIMLKELEISS
ncbi:hypothetical protein ACOME3_000557 [Neoechinorhynchus agilis]